MCISPNIPFSASQITTIIVYCEDIKEVNTTIWISGSVILLKMIGLKHELVQIFEREMKVWLIGLFNSPPLEVAIVGKISSKQ